MTSKKSPIAPVVHAARLPDEPPAGTVVIDRAGIAWQRRGATLVNGAMWHSTHRIHNLAGPLNWANLLTDRGPVTEIHRPEPSR
jgi:hypothetical protein